MSSDFNEEAVAAVTDDFKKIADSLGQLQKQDLIGFAKILRDNPEVRDRLEMVSKLVIKADNLDGSKIAGRVMAYHY